MHLWVSVGNRTSGFFYLTVVVQPAEMSEEGDFQEGNVLYPAEQRSNNPPDSQTFDQPNDWLHADGLRWLVNRRAAERAVRRSHDGHRIKRRTDAAIINQTGQSSRSVNRTAAKMWTPAGWSNRRETDTFSIHYSRSFLPSEHMNTTVLCANTLSVNRLEMMYDDIFNLDVFVNFLKLLKNF